MSKKNKMVKVIYITGYGRSGTTLLDRILGQIKGFFSIGELGHIWKRSFGENQLCGCGKPFRECEFWKAVVEEAFGGFDKIDVDKVYALKHSVERIRYIPKLMFPSLRSSKYQKHLSEYIELLNRLYNSIRNVSGSTYIIDSTKDTPYGFVLATIPNIEINVVHLVRDSRGVAYSWQKKKRRPEIYWKEEYMPRYSPLKSAREWTLSNILAHWLRAKAKRYIFIRYEDFVTYPKESLKVILEKLEINKNKIDFIDERTVNLEINHTVSGNPIRFKHGTVELRPDFEWQKKMPFSQRIIVTTLTWPLLVKYRYLLRS